MGRLMDDGREDPARFYLGARDALHREGTTVNSLDQFKRRLSRGSASTGGANASSWFEDV